MVDPYLIGSVACFTGAFAVIVVGINLAIRDHRRRRRR